MIKWRLGMVGLVVAAVLAPSIWIRCCPAADAPATAAATPHVHAFENEIKAYETADMKALPPEGAIEFIGASGIRMWKSLPQDFPDCKVFNRGFGGSQMADSVYYADRIVIPYKPKLIIIQAGGNDINAGKSPQQVLADFKAFVDKVRAALPDVRIAFLGLNPSPARWAQREKQQKANQLVKDYIAAGKNLDFIEFWDVLLGPDGTPRADLFIPDRLHNNAAGYKIRADVVRPHLALPTP